MASRKLKNKPLLEAILEIRWGVPIAPNQLDPHYKLHLARLFDRFQPDYPFHEQLPAAYIPDEMARQVVQHRFRAKANDWPVVQVGPGVFTFNETQNYEWLDFRTKAIDAVTKLFSTHPNSTAIKVENLFLRYINTVAFDYHSQDVFSFLKDKMRISIALPSEMFASALVLPKPGAFNWQATFPCKKPMGHIVIKFETGLKEGQPVLYWETMVVSSGTERLNMPNDFAEWLDAAHFIIDDWFFKLIAGELEINFDECTVSTLHP